MSANLFSLDQTHFENLDSSRSVEIIRKLIWAESNRISIPFNSINISLNVNVGDGGIDARINHDLDLNTGNNIVRHGLTCYQIKSGRTFNPWQKSEIRKELFGDLTPDLNNLKPGIKNCLEQNGTYILICTGIDLVDSQMISAKEHISDYLISSCGLLSPQFDVWSINQLISFIEPFYPSLCLDIKGLKGFKFQTHKSWSLNEDMLKQFIGESRNQFIDDFRDVLTYNGNDAIHIRVLGDPGIGKTKLVNEVTSREDLANHVIYSNAIDFIEGNLLNEILKTDNNYNICLVIDECDNSLKFDIWNKLKNRGKRIKVITIYNDLKNINDNIYFIIEKLDNDDVERIVASYGVPYDQATKFAYLCDGSPRVAHVLGNNLQNNPEDLLKTLDYVDVWNRYITDPNLSAEENKMNLLILEYLSLFRKWGYNDSSGDLDIIFNIINKSDPTVTIDKFNNALVGFKSKKILQGEYVLYITPKLLHIWLWNEFWNKRKNYFIVDDFIKQLNISLLENFYSMFEYAISSETSSIVKEMLSDKGLFKDDKFLKTRMGASFFLNLAKVNPKDSLATLIRIFDSKSLSDLVNFKEGRREVITVLDYTGQFEDLFKDTISLLFKFALAENESYANNAFGTFADYFSIGIGKLSTTEMPPLNRLKILKELYDDIAVEDRKLFIKALGSGLSDKTFRSVGLEGVSLLKEPKGWIPQNYNEIIYSKREYWLTLFQGYSDYNSDEKLIIYEIINNSLYHLGKEKELSQLVIATLKKIIIEDSKAKEVLIHNIIRTSKWINSDNDNKGEIAQAWTELCTYLEGGDFNSKMKRYVGMNVLEDEYDEDGKRINILENRLSELAEIYISKNKIADNELNWLFTKQALNGFQFGNLVSKIDNKYSLLNDILLKQESIKSESSLFFLSGYLKNVYENNTDLWENTIKEISNDNNRTKWVPEIIWRIGTSDKLILLLNELLEKRKLDYGDFMLFNYGRPFDNVTEKTFLLFMNTLISFNNIHVYSLCLRSFELFYNTQNNKLNIPKDITHKILIGLIDVGIINNQSLNQLDDFHFEILCGLYLNKFPNEYYVIAKKLVETFGIKYSITEYSHSRAIRLLEELVKQNPVELWGMISDCLGPPIDKRAFEINRWLRGRDYHSNTERESNPIFQFIPLFEIWKWVDKDVLVRASYLASFVPNKLFKVDSINCLAREVLVKYGTIEKVKKNLVSNFMTEGFSGPGSIHYEEKKRQLLDFKEKENDINVIHWIDDFVTMLDDRIKAERIEEERWER